MKSAWHKLSNHRWLQAVVFTGALNSIWPWLPMEPAYDITEIASAGAAREIVASNMNDAGVVVGQFSGQRAGVFVFADGVFKEIAVPSHPDGNQYVNVKAINNNGTMVGQIQTAPKSGPHALVLFLHHDGKTRIDLPWPQGFLAVDINDAGHVLADGSIKVPCSGAAPTSPSASASAGDCQTAAYLIARGDAVELRHGKDYARPSAMNQHDRVVFLKGPRGYDGDHAINAQGVTVGSSLSNGGTAAYVREPGEEPRHLPLRGRWAAALSINEAGDIVGTQDGSTLLPMLPMSTFGGGPFLMRDGTLYSLKRLARFGWWSGATLQPIKINNRGQILINVTEGRVRRALLLTPRAVKTPAT
jgi:hypothetical protein